MGVLPSEGSTYDHWNQYQHWQGQEYDPYYYPDTSYHPYPDHPAYPYPEEQAYYPQYPGQYYHTIFPSSSPHYPYTPQMTRIEKIRRQKQLELQSMIANPFLGERTIFGIDLPGAGDIYKHLVSKKK